MYVVDITLYAVDISSSLAKGFAHGPLSLGRLSWNFGSTRSRFLLLLAASNQIAANNRSRVCSRKCQH